MMIYLKPIIQMHLVKVNVRLVNSFINGDYINKLKCQSQSIFVIRSLCSCKNCKMILL